MDEKKYVQHISGQGAVWEVHSHNTYEWNVKPAQGDKCSVFHELPKSEYKLCDPPEQWVQVTEGIDIGRYEDDAFTLPTTYGSLNKYLYVTHHNANICHNKDYKFVLDGSTIKIMRKVS